MEPAPTEREAFIAYHVRTAKVFASPAFAISDAERAATAAAVFDRAFHPEGTARQYAAIVADGDRRERLRAIAAPTRIIHGVDDPLVPIEGSRDTARHVPGSELIEIPGMGHDLPPGLYDRFVELLSSHTAKAEAAG